MDTTTGWNWAVAGPPLGARGVNPLNGYDTSVYARDATADVFRATSLLVVTFAGRRITAITRFDTSVLQHFGLPRILPE